ncbi:hypothetical protein ACT54M_18250, partial [Leptospira santarosai]
SIFITMIHFSHTDFVTGVNQNGAPSGLEKRGLDASIPTKQEGCISKHETTVRSRRFWGDL